MTARSDVVTLHLPLTDQTRHLVGGVFLAQVKPGRPPRIRCSVIPSSSPRT